MANPNHFSAERIVGVKTRPAIESVSLYFVDAQTIAFELTIPGDQFLRLHREIQHQVTTNTWLLSLSSKKDQS
jgi:hypothetical protein